MSKNVYFNSLPIPNIFRYSNDQEEVFNGVEFRPLYEYWNPLIHTHIFPWQETYLTQWFKKYEINK